MVDEISVLNSNISIYTVLQWCSRLAFHSEEAYWSGQKMVQRGAFYNGCRRTRMRSSNSVKTQLAVFITGPQVADAGMGVFVGLR